MDEVKKILYELEFPETREDQAFLLFIPPLILYPIVIIALRAILNTTSDVYKANLRKMVTPYHNMWNLILSIFSGYGAYHTVSQLYNTGITCDIEPETFFALELFCLSKTPELLDTIFIVLKNRPLVLLQYYHHFATLFLCYYGYLTMADGLLVAAAMNYFVHFVMYGYFFLTAIGMNFLRRYGYLVTWLQFLQMAVAVYLIITLDPHGCIENSVSMYDLKCISGVIYGSYLILFGELLFSKIVKSEKKKI